MNYKGLRMTKSKVSQKNTLPKRKEEDFFEEPKGRDLAMCQAKPLPLLKIWIK